MLCQLLRSHVRRITRFNRYSTRCLNLEKHRTATLQSHLLSSVPCPLKIKLYAFYSNETELSANKFEEVCEETLELLCEYFEELAETSPILINADIAYSDGVITANLGNNIGTYVINRQTPNKQIWLSSPTSGPKRYDFINGEWIYRHDKSSLNSLLDVEISLILKEPTQFSVRCSSTTLEK